MITQTFTKEETFALLAMVNYLYLSAIELDKIEDQEQRDTIELNLRRAIDDLKNITNEMEQSLNPKLSEMHKQMVEEYKAMDSEVTA